MKEKFKFLVLYYKKKGFSIIGGYWSRRHFHAVCFSGFSAMLDLYMGGELGITPTKSNLNLRAESFPSILFSSFPLLLEISVADPLHFDMNPDPRIRFVK